MPGFQSVFSVFLHVLAALAISSIRVNIYLHWFVLQDGFMDAII